MSLNSENVNMTIDEPIVAQNIESEWIPVEDQDYEFYTDYNDENISTVNDEKIISLNPKQINVTQETNSQYIPFHINRYYDGFDLTKIKLYFYFVNRQGQYGVNNAVDVYYNEDTIKLAWLVDSSATALDGKLKFEIRGEGTNSKGYKYLWKTQPNSEINIIKSLQSKNFIQPDDSWQETFLTKIDAKLAEANNAVLRAQDAVVESESFANKSKEIADNLAQTTIDSLRNQIEGIIQDIIEESFDQQITETINTKLDDYYSNMTSTLTETREYIGIS